MLFWNLFGDTECGVISTIDPRKTATARSGIGMSSTTFDEDPEDWTPEENSVAIDPLTFEEMDDKQIQFYADRVQRQIEMMLNAER